MINYTELDKEQFSFKDCVIGGDECVLVTPNNITAKWTKDNLNYRSVIVRKSDGLKVSCSLKKFFNNLEKPDLYPDPLKYRDLICEEKCDGSTCIISVHNGELIVRTRGTISAFEHENGEELQQLLDKNTLIEEWARAHEGFTLLFEWLSLRPIVIRHKKPELVLIGCIKNKDYSMLSTFEIDEIAKTLNVRRPEKFTFNSIEEIIKTCESLKNFEGFVVNFNNNQNRVKIKTPHYLALHRMKSELCSFDRVLDLYMILGEPSYEQFYDHIATNFDFELAEINKNYLQRVCDLNREVSNLLCDMKNVIGGLKGLARKEAAFKIIQFYGKNNCAGFAFMMLDGKELNIDNKKKLYYNLLKNE